MMSVLRLGPAAASALSFLLIALPSGVSHAGSRIEVSYAVTYLHVTIGAGHWSLNMSGNRYTTTASGEVKGMMSYLINGEGSAHTDGLITHGSPSANRFAAHVVSTAEMDDITIIFQNGTVRELHAMPTFPPIPTRVTVSAADLVDVSDPLSAALAFMGGRNVLDSSLCDRRLRIFDGRRRFDVALSYKRTKSVSVPPAFEGTGTVCAAQLFPIAGQQVKNSTVKYLVESKDLEIEYALIPEAGAYIPVAAVLPTLIGTVHVNAVGLTITDSDRKD